MQRHERNCQNWAGSGPEDFPNAKAISDEAVLKYQEGKFGCWQCPIACGGLLRVTKGPYATEETVHKPEYETLCALGTLCLNDNVESIIKLNDICNRMGLDTISTGCAIAFAIECYENGIITKKDTGGIELTWGNHEAIVAMTEKIAKREGFGDILADGTKRAASKIGKGSEEFAIHISGQELPMHDPKLNPGLATTYQLDATPARHTLGSEGFLVPPAGLKLSKHERTVYTGRAEDHRKAASLMHVVNATGLCMFGYLSFDARYIPDAINAVTGWDVTMEELMEIGERIATVRHLFNLREGINPMKLKVPGRMLGKPPLSTGNLKGITVDSETMIKEYLHAMGWDAVTTKPSPERLKALGLEEMM